MALGAMLALSMAWLYAAPLWGLVREWLSSPDASYGVVLAAVALAVVWRRRAIVARDADPRAAFAPGAATLIAGLALYLIGQLGADLFITRISFVVVVTGALWFLTGGRAVRALAAPLLFLLVAIPLPALVVNALTLPLQTVASRIGEAGLNAAGVAVFRDGNLLELPSATLEVAEACSGLRSLVSLAAIGGLLAWAQPSWPRRAAIVAASLPIAIVMNGLRIAATGLAVESWGPRVAAGGWHTFSGWVTFLLSLLVLAHIHRLLSAPDARELRNLQAVGV